jgi:hypothetical protein
MNRKFYSTIINRTVRCRAIGEPFSRLRDALSGEIDAKPNGMITIDPNFKRTNGIKAIHEKHTGGTPSLSWLSQICARVESYKILY